jgi:hypothetical protein
MKVYIRGKGAVTLRQQDFRAKGGEGKIFVQGNTAYKIYEDLNKLIPEGKIQELQALKNPQIIKPKDVILDKKNTFIGFTMDAIDGQPLCKLFTNTFRDANSILPVHTVELVEFIKDITKQIHEAKCLIVDGNELNYIVDGPKFVTPYFIDVNSWQTPSYPATAIMPSVRDYQSKDFSELTDWYSFAIISCQLFVGIHPFKGRHPDYKKNDFVSRMKNNVSIFNKNVTTPSAVRDFSLIPKNYMDWYVALFEKGDRSLPPGIAVKLGPITTKRVVIQSTDNFDIKELLTLKNDIIFHAVMNGISISKSGTGLYIGSKAFFINPEEEVLFTPKMCHPIGVARIPSKKYGGPDKMVFRSFDKNIKVDQIDLDVSSHMISENILYVLNNGILIQIDLYESGNKVIPTVMATWDVMPNSTTMFSGVLHESILGSSYLVIPVACGSVSQFHHLRIKELDNYRVIDAKYMNHVCVLTCHDGQKYDRLIIKFGKDFNYSIMVDEDVDYVPINFTVLEKGIAVMIVEDGRMLLFSNRPEQQSVKEIIDPAISPDMKLVEDGNNLRFFQGNKICTITMKK